MGPCRGVQAGSAAPAPGRSVRNIRTDIARRHSRAIASRPASAVRRPRRPPHLGPQRPPECRAPAAIGRVTPRSWPRPMP